MARKALLIWCVGSALACGTAALATTSLWRAPATTAAAADGRIAFPEIAPPAPLAEIEAPVDAYVSLASVSFYEETSAPPPFRGSFDAAPSIAATLAALPSEGFNELDADSAGSDDRLAIRPPPRPAFLLARLDAAAKAIGEVDRAQPAPGFETPSTPVLAFGDAFRSLSESGRPERIINAGIASWYGPGFHGRKTASGERFDQNDLTAAHRTLPFGSRVKVVDERTGRSIVVRINDRGPFKHGRVIDLSKAAAQALGVGGLSRVKLVSAE